MPLPQLSNASPVEQTLSRLNLNQATINPLKTTYLTDIQEQQLTSPNSVDLAVRLMDSRYHTQFYNWIKDEKHCDFIAFHLKKLIVDYDSEQISRAIKWLLEGWTINAQAAVLIKIFYEKGLDYPLFCGIVRDLLNTSSKKGDSAIAEELLATLVIGEDATITARFLAQVLQESSVTEKTRIIQNIADRSRWPTKFSNQFLAYFIGMHVSTNEVTIPVDKIERVKKQLEQSHQLSFGTRMKIMFREFVPTSPSQIQVVLPDESEEELVKRTIWSLQQQSEGINMPVSPKEVSLASSPRDVLDEL